MNQRPDTRQDGPAHDVPCTGKRRTDQVWQVVVSEDHDFLLEIADVKV